MADFQNKRMMNKRQQRRREVPYGPSHPPQLNGIELRHAVTLRYLTGAAANVYTSITFANLLDTLLVALTAVTAQDLFQTVKIRRVRVWSVPALGTTSSVSVEFSGVTAGIVGDQAIHTDTSMGIEPAYVSARPSPKCLAADYQVSSAAVAFILNCPPGSVLDLELSFRSQYATANAAAAVAPVGATPGAQYIRGCDGLATAASQFVPEYGLAQI